MKNFLLGCLFLIGAYLHAVEGVFEFDYPNTKIIAIQDKAVRFPQSLFFPAGTTDYTQKENDYEASVNVFLIVNRNNGELSLIDAGYGDASGGLLSQKLQELKIDSSKVKSVFITHIHPDHVGGLLKQTDTKLADDKIFSHRMIPQFPDATIYIAQEEYDSWKKDSKRSELAKYLAPYTPDRLHLFADKKELCGTFGRLFPHKTAGHTPGHTVYEMVISPCTPTGDSNIAPGKYESVFFVGDILHAVDLQISHFEFCAKFDMNPGLAVSARNEALLTYRGYWFGAHFPFPGKIGIIKKIYASKGDSFSYFKAK